MAISRRGLSEGDSNRLHIFVSLNRELNMARHTHVRVAQRDQDLLDTLGTAAALASPCKVTCGAPAASGRKFYVT